MGLFPTTAPSDTWQQYKSERWVGEWQKLNLNDKTNKFRRIIRLILVKRRKSLDKSISLYKF